MRISDWSSDVCSSDLAPPSPLSPPTPPALPEPDSFMALQGGWPAVPEGETLKPGMTDPRVGQLRNRLRLLGDLKPQDDLAERGGDANFYDESLVPAVKWMQYRHGLAQDGAVGRRTLAALNVPIEQDRKSTRLNSS